MGIDKLNAAARAAGFAMAVSDEYAIPTSTQRSAAEAKDGERSQPASTSTALIVRAAKPQLSWATWGLGWSFWRTA
jgi:hypothetical protein